MWQETDEVILEISDHGHGIPAQEQKKIFQPFYRAAKGGETGGCGLGLFLVSEVMANHGGRIDVISEANEGARFRLFFPISPSAAEMREKPGEPDFLRAH
jgi:two-component system OmpR family sensor kinase